MKPVQPEAECKPEMPADWIEWKGGECPIPNAFGRDYEIMMRGQRGHAIRPIAPANLWRWAHKERATDIVAYREAPVDA